MIPSSDVSNKGSDQGYLLSHKATKPGAGNVSEMTHQLQVNSNEHHSLETELSFAASSAAVETSGRHESLSVTIPSKCYEEGPWGDVQAIDRISNNDTTSRDNRCPPTASTTAIMATRSRQQDCISGNSNNEDKIELLMRDVAARIIQTYWRTWRAWKRKLRSDAEERTLRMFLDSGSGCHVSATSSHKSLLPAASDRTSVISCSTSHNAIMPAATHYLTGHNLDTPNGSAASSSDHQHTSGVDQHVDAASTASTAKSLQPASSSVRHPKPAALNNIGAAAESASKVAENSGGASSRSPTSSQRAGIIISQAGHAAEERSTTNSSRAKGRNVSALPGGAATGSEGEAWRMASKTAKGVPPATIRGSSTARGTKQRVTATKQAAATTAVQASATIECDRPQASATIECDRRASATIECDRQASATIECDRQASGGELPSTGSRTASLGIIILPQAALKQYTSASYPTATANTVAASARGGEATSAVVQTISQPLSTAVERNSLSENVFSLSTGVPAAAAATGQMLSLPTSSSRSFGAASRSEGGLKVLTASLTSDKLQSILDFLDDVDEQHVAEDGPSSSSATEVLLTKSSESSARACGSKSSSKVHSSSHDVLTTSDHDEVTTSTESSRTGYAAAVSEKGRFSAVKRRVGPPDAQSASAVLHGALGDHHVHSKQTAAAAAAADYSLHHHSRHSATTPPAVIMRASFNSDKIMSADTATSDMMIAENKARSVSDTTGWSMQGNGIKHTELIQDKARRRTTTAPSVISLSKEPALGTITGKPAAYLAESVYDGVRAKLRRMQEEVTSKDHVIEGLYKEKEALQVLHSRALSDAESRLQDTLAAQRDHHEAGLARHLGFIDRIMADKDDLSRKCDSLAELIRSSEERHEVAMQKMKGGWADELRKQREGWAAAEKLKRDAWMEAKTREVKEATVKGLEQEVQKLLTRHKAELLAGQQAAADEARRQLEAVAAQHEVIMRQQRDKMLRDQEDAVDRERQAAQGRLREASERYEQQLQTQRMRLMADADLRFESLEGSRRDERKHSEEALAKAAADAKAREVRVLEESKLEREALRKTYDKQLEALREQYETGQEGWRAAIAERARREVSEREAAIKEKLTRERDEEVEAIILRLEAEHASSLEETHQKWKKKEESIVKKHVNALQEAKKAEARLAEHFRQAGTSLEASESLLSDQQKQLEQLRRELAAKCETIQWLESQVNAAKEDAGGKEHRLRSLTAQKDEAQQQALDKALKEKEDALIQAAQLEKEVTEIGRRHSREMAHVEEKVKAALSKKDEMILGLRAQAMQLSRQLQETEAILSQQQEELRSM
ncbi:hypothetical protein CEUSTIGMA_g8609.t1 [Chlamydomonas eustigma]|uniref:Uncharacterized protein n=1 Tax=Chlamydomonas eustigma TaxID=1157962 RepID=A0A250XDP1_9CHLO|nr:hypothetical protein CEUSTIGMA_g8609.t1 [Chlamydomonas eustigma]|eukprot:GAX81176.1 hypothetical protein CEUSTIGMA_g8609.t1 [Chlamydomonas eustigma]